MEAGGGEWRGVRQVQQDAHTHWQVVKRPQLLRSTRHTPFTVEENRYFLLEVGSVYKG